MQREYVCGQKRYINIEVTHRKETSPTPIPYILLFTSLAFATIIFI